MHDCPGRDHPLTSNVEPFYIEELILSTVLERPSPSVRTALGGGAPGSCLRFYGRHPFRLPPRLRMNIPPYISNC